MTDETTERRNAIARALLAAVLVGGAHVAAFAWLTTHSLSTEPKDSVLGAPIELDLLAVAPPEPPHDVAPPAPTAPDPPPPSPEPTPTQDAPPPPDPTPPPEPTPEPSPPPLTPEPSPPPPVQEEPPPPAPEPTPDLPTPTPTPTKAAPPDAVVAPSPPPSKPPKPKPTPQKAKPTPPPKPDPEKVERDQARAEAKDRARDARRQQRADARAATNQAQTRDDSRQGASQRPVSSGSDVATWRGEVMARISAFKPSSSGASGTAVVAFTVDSGGRVISASVARSSGDAALDAASLSMVRQASPVPAPPSELGGHVRLSVPVRFQ